MERIYQTITEIEEKSEAELVVIRHGQSGNYSEVELAAGSILAAITFTAQMFVDIEIDPYTIYWITLASFFVGFLAVKFIRPLKSMILSKKKKTRNVEIYARALFQKGGIHLTKKHIGIIVFCSDLEKTATIIADNGIETKVPGEEMKKVKEALKSVYKSKDFVANVAEPLNTLSQVLQTYLPSSGKDLNEIPDDLKITL